MSLLPDWLIPLPDAEMMREVDRSATEERGIAGLELMERAGAGVARAVERLAPEGRLSVVCGKGNNGGDGLVVARLLRNAGRRVSVIFVSDPRELAGDARRNLDRLHGQGPLRLDGSEWRQAPGHGVSEGASVADVLGASAVIVDALLGTGFRGEPHGPVGEAIELINRAGVPVVSVDVPSGVEASSGALAGAAVRATLTVSLHAAKPGLWIRPGKACAGEVEVLDIGIPRDAPTVARIGLIDRSVIHLIPVRGPDATKFSSGKVVVAGGSPGLTGAPAMSALASMRAGAGYVIACIPSSIQASIASAGTPELITRGVAHKGGELSPGAVAGVLRACERAGALALGPGLGRSEAAVAFARRLAREAELPLVLDADGLNAHAGVLEELISRAAPTVLTPHAGELGRLLELESADVERERLRHVRAAAERSGAVVLLKGDDTLIAAPDGRVAVSAGASPALATAGTGDVLTGVIAALLAQGLSDPFAAAAAGVWLHAEAGRLAARRVGAPEGVLASDVIAALPLARGARDQTAGEDADGG